MVSSPTSRISNSGGWDTSRSATGAKRWWRQTHLSTHLQFNHLDFVCYDRGLVTLVEGRVEHLDGVRMKLVRKARPLKFEGHLWCIAERNPSIRVDERQAQMKLSVLWWRSEIEQMKLEEFMGRFKAGGYE